MVLYFPNVPMIAYPSGCDQWYEAGVAVNANPKMDGLDSIVIDMLKNETFKTRSMQLASETDLLQMKSSSSKLTKLLWW